MAEYNHASSVLNSMMLQIKFENFLYLELVYGSLFLPFKRILLPLNRQ